MRPLSVRFKREVVACFVFAAFFALYFPLQDASWSLYAALPVSYTILVFGLLWSDGKWHRYVEAHQRTARELAQRHTIYLLVLILWIWICRFSRPWLPDWMFFESIHDLTPYLVFSALGIVAIWWVEQGWWAKPPKQEERIGASPQ